MGKVIVSGPEVKKVMTKSSRLSVKASSAPATSPGTRCGTMISRKIAHSPAPRSRAASASAPSKLASRARTTSATKLNEKVAWAMMITPRLAGHGNSAGHGTMAVKNTRKATPRQISGTTIGRPSAASSADLPAKRNRHSSSAAAVPRTRLISVEAAAITSELPNASSSSPSSSSSPYQRSEKPRHTLMRRLSLNENTTRLSSGRYKNAPTSASHSRNGQRAR